MPSDPSKKSFTLLIICLNASDYICDLLRDIVAQGYPQEKREILILDSCSKDGTKEICESFARNHPNEDIRVYSNEGIFLAPGWNKGIALARCEYIIRVDANVRLPTDFLKRNNSLINEGRYIVGGRVQSISYESLWKKLIYLVESSRFAGGIAAFRNYRKPGPIGALAYAAYPKELFYKLGGFDERVVRHQDNLFHSQLHENGYHYDYHPDIVSFRYGRSTLNGLLKQSFQNGFWIPLAMLIQPRSFSWYHFIPFLFSLYVIASLLLFLQFSSVFPLLGLCVYLLVNVFYSCRTSLALKGKQILASVLFPFLFAAIHFTYGLGSILGSLWIPFFKVIHCKYKMPDFNCVEVDVLD